MTKKIASRSKKVSPKESNLFKNIVLFEEAGAQGIILCAPKVLKGHINALKYTVRGEFPPKNTWQRELAQYITEARVETVAISRKKGKKEIQQEFKVRYYRLSPTGEAWIAHYRENQRKALEEEAQKKAQTIEGIRTLLQEHVSKIDDIEKEIQHWQALPEVLGQECWQKLAEFARTGNFDQQIRAIFDECLKLWTEMLQREIQPIVAKAQEMANWQQNLPQKMAERLKQETTKFETEMKNIRVASDALVSALQKSLLLQTQGDVPPVPIAREPKRKQVSRGQAMFDFSSPDSLPELEAQLVSKILPLIPVDCPKLISSLYEELRAQNVHIRPGHLNDLLWSLYLEKKVEFYPWQRLLSELATPEHAIFRPDAKVYAHVQRSKE